MSKIALACPSFPVLFNVSSIQILTNILSGRYYHVEKSHYVLHAKYFKGMNGYYKMPFRKYMYIMCELFYPNIYVQTYVFHWLCKWLH